ncbi:MAG: hypothetical protein HeimC3_12140 [Candidatus Heimdallarchaeota archaeon LC_3]|nr:MAG: hypothetical protein HeimC3_12140 [Candidatus Heimdallarchaeota archaeon LC_3]
MLIDLNKFFNNFTIFVLSLYHNNFTEFPYNFSIYHPKLWMINFFFNKISELPDWLLNLSKLQLLEIFGNPNLYIHLQVRNKFEDRRIALV